MANYAAVSESVRQELLQLPGARLCGIGGCQVITQGGTKGLVEHRRVCHYSDRWIRAD